MRLWTMTRVVLLMVAVTMVTPSAGRPSLEFAEGHIQRMIRSDDIDGYDTATVYALDTASNEETRQTKRDIETHASDSSSSKRRFSLQLTSGERLRMSLDRRSVDTSGAKFIEITEEGEREITLPRRDCFFSGRLDGRLEGFASFAMCDGELTGSIVTSKRDYEIQTLRNTGGKRDANDVMRVLVTWSDNDRERRGSSQELDDGLEIPEDESSETLDAKMEIPDEDDSFDRSSVSDRKATIEIGDYVDKYFLEKAESKMGLNTSEKVIELLLSKWSGAANILSDEDRVGWNLTLRLVKVVIMRTDPDFYQPVRPEKLGQRMKKICNGTRNETLDQVTLHTSRTSNPKFVGLAWKSGMCRRKFRCTATKAVKSSFMVELHELGHTMGLGHDYKMADCVNDTDTTRGFMAGNRDHFRNCYRTVLDKKFTQRNKRCIFTNANSEYLQDFP